MFQASWASLSLIIFMLFSIDYYYYFYFFFNSCAIWVLPLLRTLSLCLGLGVALKVLLRVEVSVSRCVCGCMCVWVAFYLHFAIEASVFHAHLQFASMLPPHASVCYMRLKDLVGRLELQHGAIAEAYNQRHGYQRDVSLSCYPPNYSSPTRLPFTHLTA